MEIVFLLLVLVWLSYHPIYILYGLIGFVVLVFMYAYTPRLLKSILIGIPGGWIVFLGVSAEMHPIDPTQAQTIACYVGTILALWLVQIAFGLPQIREELRMRKEMKQIHQREVHPMPVGFVPDKTAKQRHARSKPVPMGFQPPGDEEGSSIAWSQKTQKKD